MMRLGETTSFARSRLLSGVCGAALLAMIAAPAAAQDADAESQAADTQEEATQTEDPDDIIVMGIRQNIESAQARKRNADTVVDSLTADEIGSFPDKSVAEALQRVAGIVVSRFAGTDDTSHFSAEPSGVIVRGLPQVRSEFNGRDTFSANSSRGLSYSDISPELLAGVDTYKNQTAELIEGGIAGTINLRTRLPFDNKDRLFSVSADVSYGDIAEQATPAFSGIYSDRFDTEMGEFGIMVNGAYSRVKTGSQGVQFDRMAIFDGVFGDGLQYIPSGIWMRDNLYDRKRYGISVAGQWQSNDGKKELSVQYNRSQYDNSWRERSVYSSAFSIYGLPTDYRVTDPTLVAPLTGTDPFTFDDEGNFLTGWWSAPRPYLGEPPTSADQVEPSLGYGVNENGQPFFNRCYTWGDPIFSPPCTTGETQRAPQIDTASNALRNKQYTQDIGANFRWDVSDRLGLRFDAQYVTSEVKNYNASVTTRTFADTFIDLTGEYPRFEIIPDTGENINLANGGTSNPNNYHYYAITDHTEDSDGEEIALRLDTDYDFESDWLDSLRMGVRYSDRDQEVKWGAYNWANIANNWTNTQASYFNIDRPVYPGGNYENAGLGNDFFAGNQLNVNDFVFFNMDKLESREQLAAALGRPSIGVGEYYPVCSGAGYRAGESITDEFGCYLPSEVLRISERTFATYAMLKFGGPNARMGNVGVSGNIGVRLVWTRDKTDGSFTFPTPFTDEALDCERGMDNQGRPTATAGCVTGPDEIAFNSGLTIPGKARADHFNALPSFNLKLDLTDKLVSRLAYSRAISRPDVGLLRNYVTVNRIAPNLADRNNPLITYDSAGNAIAYDFQYSGRAGNPYLKPIVADQYDITLEYYFNSAGSLTGTLFYKDFKNYIQNGTYNLTVTNNGITRDVLVQGPNNGDGAKIKGVELAFTTFFNFLPSPLDGFGIQANYTYVDNDGIETINLVSETAGGTAGGGVSYDTTAVKADALEGISDHSFNLIGMYEKGRLSARAAYNWRSKYLVTAVDCCVGLPIWQDSAGFLDASIRYRVTDWIELSIQGSNLLGTDTVLKQQVDSDGTLKANSWFKNDRRVQAGIRVTL